MSSTSLEQTASDQLFHVSECVCQNYHNRLLTCKPIAISNAFNTVLSSICLYYFNLNILVSYALCQVNKLINKFMQRYIGITLRCITSFATICLQSSYHKNCSHLDAVSCQIP